LLIVGSLKEGEKVFVFGCGNCVEKCQSGGQQETQQMKERLQAKGVNVVGTASNGKRQRSL